MLTVLLYENSGAAGVSGEQHKGRDGNKRRVFGDTKLPLSYFPVIAPSSTTRSPHSAIHSTVLRSALKMPPSRFKGQVSISKGEEVLLPPQVPSVHSVMVIQVKTAVKSEAWRLCAHIKPHHSSNHSLAHSSLALQAGSQTRWHHHFCLYRL